MTAIKPWYSSRTVWASAVTVIMSLAGAVGLPVDNVDSGAVTDNLLQAMTAVSGLVALFCRVSATCRIGKNR